MTPPAASLGDPDPEQRAALAQAFARWREHRRDGAAPLGAGAAVDAAAAQAETRHFAVEDVSLEAVEVLTPGRPGVVDVLARVGDRLAHAVFGLHLPSDEPHVVGLVEEAALGMVEDDQGPAIVVDALHDADAARILLDVVAGHEVATGRMRQGRRGLEQGRDPRLEPAPAVVTVTADDEDATTLTFARRCTLTVFPWVRPGPHPGVAMLVGLDEAGFNHVAAPLAVWRRGGLDLGVVQELLAGSAAGWALALASLRDLFASGGAPAAAGGDFGPEARALGTMAARMHLALDQAFGRQAGDVGAWAAGVEAAVNGSPAGLVDSGALDQAVAAIQADGGPAPMVRTHGDFHLGRTARTDHGWVLADWLPGGAEPGSEEPVFRSPLADVGDMMWSLRRAADLAVSAVATTPSPRDELAEAWVGRNRRAFMAGYLSVSGIGDLLPADADVVGWTVSLFEMARAARAGRPVLAGAD